MDTRAKPPPLWTVWKQIDHSPTPSQPLRVYFTPSPALPEPFTDTPNRFVIGYGPCFGTQF